MKQTKNYLDIASLVAVGAILACCNKIEEASMLPQLEENTVTQTTTISFADNQSTKALTAAGVKTFAAGEQIAVVYENTSSEIVKAVSEELTDSDITGTGEQLNKTATFTVTLTNPKPSGSVKYIYPAAMAGDTDVDYTKLNTQDGTLTTLASTLDLAEYEGLLTAEAQLPASPTLTNQLAILALTLKTINGSSEVTGSITSMSITDGTYSYAVTRSAAAGPIYVAVRPTTSANIELTATDGANNYYNKFLVNKTYAAGNGYSIPLKMGLAGNALSGQFTINTGGDKVKFAQGNLQATYDGKSWTWRFATNQWDRIGDAAMTPTGNGNVALNGDGTLSDNGTVDLFTWVGASNTTWTGVAKYGVTISTTTNSTSTYGNVAGEALKSDWGNAIGPGWRTLSQNEWTYLVSLRTSGSTVNGTENARYVHATINTDGTGVNGVILFPDGITVEGSEATTWGSINHTSTWENATKCTSAQWTALAAKGCVFLPLAGWRHGAGAFNLAVNGCYWTSSSVSGKVNQGYCVYFWSNCLYSNYADYYRDKGCAVRLVRDAE